MDDDPLLEQSVELPEDQTGTQPIETPHYNKPRRSKKWLFIVLGLLFAGSSGFALWKYVLTKPAAPAAQTTTPPTPTPSPVAANDIPDSTETEIYDNGPLGVTLTYPVSWKVTETENKGVRIESPDFRITTADDLATTGNFRIYIRKGARTQDSTYIGRGVALKDSEKLTYTNPALGQRIDTLLSSFGLDEPTAFNYFFVAGNFQLKKGDTLGPNYGKEPSTFIIAGGYSSAELTDDMAFYSVDPSVTATSNAYRQAVTIIESLELH